MSLRQDIDTLVKERVAMAQEVINCAHTLLTEGRIGPDLFKDALDACERGLPYCAEEMLSTHLVRTALAVLLQDVPDLTCPI